MPGASPIVINPASMTRRVGFAAPATMACGVALPDHHAGEIKRLRHQASAHRRRHGSACAGAGCAIGLQARIAARIDQFDAVERDAGGARGFGDRVRRAEHDRMRDFPVNETARGGEHANVIAFRQNDLEMTTAVLYRNNVRWDSC